MKYYRFEQKGKFGFREGNKIIIPAQYDAAEYYLSEYAIVSFNGKFGIIDNTGHFVIKNIYDDLKKLFDCYYCFRINNGNDWVCGVLNLDGKEIVSRDFKHILSVDERYFKCYKEAECKEVKFENFGLYGHYTYNDAKTCLWYNLKGQFITDIEVTSVAEDFLIVKNACNHYGIIDNSGKICIEPFYDSIEFCIKNRFIASLKEGSETIYKVIDSKNSERLVSKKTITFDNGFFCLKDTDEVEWYSIDGLLVHKGKASPLSKDFIAIPKNGKWGVVNANKERVINFLYNQIVLLGECFAVLREDNIGLIGLRGEIIVDAIYNNIECVKIKNDDYCLGSKEKLSIGGIIDTTRYLGYCAEYAFDTDGHVDYRGLKYDALSRCAITTYQKVQTGFGLSCPKNFDLSKPLILSTEDYQELFTKEEGIVENSRFCNIQQITQQCFVVQQDDLYGVFRIDLKSLIIPIEFKRIKFMGGHTVLMCKDDLWGAADLLLDSHLFKSLFKVNIECKNAEVSILNDDQSLFGAKIPYKNLLDEDESYYAILNQDGEETGDFYFHFIESQFVRYDDRHFLTSKQGKCGFITKSAHISIPFIYDEISPRGGEILILGLVMLGALWI